MQPFTRLEAIAVPLPYSNIDTDQLIPARFMSRPRAQGYGDLLLHDMRTKPGFPLDDPAYAGARIVVARRNFGCGSSREAAVYALVDAGIRCVIAPSFGDIFAANACNNGLLAAQVTEDAAEALLARLQAGDNRLHVDLEHCLIGDIGFQVEPVTRIKLLRGWEDLDLTRSHQDAIAAFADADRHRRPWATPTTEPPTCPTP
jgi:3-isopropylmalate/(R)-2-methylmalate dehydratase small subunit